MTAQIEAPRFSREDLDRPVTWRAMNEIHIPLSYAVGKFLEQVLLQVVVFLLAIFPMSLAVMFTFRPFMHLIKPWTDDIAIRSNLYVAVFVVSLWLFSRVIGRTPLKRLKFLLHVIPVALVSLKMTFAFG